MTETEKALEELRAKHAALEQRAKELEAKDSVSASSLREARRMKRDHLIAKHQSEGRITPTMLAGVRDYGELCGDDVPKFETFLKALPVVTRATPIGVAPSVSGQTELTQVERTSAA